MKVKKMENVKIMEMGSNSKIKINRLKKSEACVEWEEKENDFITSP